MESEVEKLKNWNIAKLTWRCGAKARRDCVQVDHLGVYEKVDEKEAVVKYGITPVDTKWVDTGSVRGRAIADQITKVCERLQK